MVSYGQYWCHASVYPIQSCLHRGTSCILMQTYSLLLTTMGLRLHGSMVQSPLTEQSAVITSSARIMGTA